MSVVLLDMDMPETCRKCTLESHCNKWLEGSKNFGRHPNCPLAETPKPEPERNVGTWISVDSCMTVCSECGMIGCGTPYCPNCGAKMNTDSQVEVGDVVVHREQLDEPHVVLRKFTDENGNEMVTLLRRSDGEIYTHHLYYNGQRNYNKTGQYFEQVPELMEELISEYE